jgi:DNA-directed RNA polymerase specialized sigma24 family protein
VKNEQTVAWAWVLENASLIEGIVKKLSNGSVLDFEDLRSDVLVRLVEKWPNYDKKKSSPSTWIWWQTLAVRKQLLKKHRSFSSLKEDHKVQNPAAIAIVQLKEIKQMSTAEEWAAVAFMAQGFDGSKLGQLCGCAPFSARRRAARLRERYNQAT